LKLAIAIERETNGEVRAEDLRPDLKPLIEQIKGRVEKEVKEKLMKAIS
jgi:DNA-binding transcriptional regulator YdaS (Cro superfamily)